MTAGGRVALVCIPLLDEQREEDIVVERGDLNVRGDEDIAALLDNSHARAGTCFKTRRQKAGRRLAGVGRILRVTESGYMAVRYVLLLEISIVVA